MGLIRGHSHIELGRKGDCPGCQAKISDQVNPNAPEGCSYTFMGNGTDGFDWVCKRHGFFAPLDVQINRQSTTPCQAIQ